MHVKVQSCLMQAHFIKIPQVFEKKMSDTFLTNGQRLVTRTASPADLQLTECITTQYTLVDLIPYH